MKAVITGVTGFIGKSLADKLLRSGVYVYGVGRNFDKSQKLLQYKNFKMIQLDFYNYKKLDHIIEDNDIDLFFHMAHMGVNGAGKINYKIQLENSIVACEVVEAARRLNCKRFVFSGSIDEYEINYSPDDPFKEPSHSRIYALCKFTSENIGKVIAYKGEMEYVSALLSLTYGEENETNILPNMLIRNSLLKKPMNLIKGNNYFDLIYISDAVDAIIAIGKNGKNMESYYVGHHELRTFKQTVLDICKILESDIELRFGSYPDANNSIDYRLIDREKLWRDTGFLCNSSEKMAILNTANWIKSTENLK